MTQGLAKGRDLGNLVPWIQEDFTLLPGFISLLIFVKAEQTLASIDLVPVPVSSESMTWSAYSGWDIVL
jgi:hypothetical protein